MLAHAARSQEAVRAPLSVQPHVGGHLEVSGCELRWLGKERGFFSAKNLLGAYFLPLKPSLCVYFML